MRSARCSISCFRISSRLLLGAIMGLISPHAIADMVDDLSQIREDTKKAPPPETDEKPQQGKAGKAKSKDSGTGSGSKTDKEKTSSQTPRKSKASKVSDEDRKKLPILLKSDGEATYTKDGGVVHLERNVRITQGDLFFRADEALAYFISVNGQDVVDRVEINGNVRITKDAPDPTESVKATGNRAFFHNNESIVRLEGDARLWQGGHLIKGNNITYDLRTSIVKVDRAEGVVQPDVDKKKNDNDQSPTRAGARKSKLEDNIDQPE